MYTLLTALTLSVLVAIVYYFKWRSKKVESGKRIDKTSYVLGTCFFILLWAMFFTFVLCMFSPADSTHTERVETERHELLAFKNSSASSGSFFLGCGTFENNDYYRYFRKVGGNGIQLQKMLADDNTVVIEDMPRGKAYMVKTVLRSTVTSRWLMPVVCEDPKYEFHIPEGTLKREFVLE